MLKFYTERLNSCFIWINSFISQYSNLSESLYIPILRNHPNLGLFISLLHIHENPIFSR